MTVRVAMTDESDTYDPDMDLKYSIKAGILTVLDESGVRHTITFEAIDQSTFYKSLRSSIRVKERIIDLAPHVYEATYRACLEWNRRRA